MSLYEILVDDGSGNTIRLVMSRSRLSKMIGGALLETVLASAEIEGEGLPPEVHIELQEPVSLPEVLLNIKGPVGPEKH